MGDANASGANLRPQTTTRGIGVLFTLGNLTPFDRHPAWQELKPLSLADRLAAIRDPHRRAELIVAAAGSPDDVELRRFFVTDGSEGGARFDCDPATSLPVAAAAAGMAPAEYFLHLADQTDGRATVYWPILNQDLDVVARMILDDTVVLGLADGGAHVGQILDASQPTWFLSYWVRDRGLVSIERAVQRLSSDGATLFGLADRGVLRPGAHADVNVIDLAALALELPEFVHDFPHGAGRYVQRARGYLATLVNGEVFMENGRHTGTLPGAVLRSA